MVSIFVIAGIISLIFCIAKFAEMRVLDKDEPKPLKFLVRDALLVYFSVLMGDFIVDQLKPIISENVNILKETTTVFTDNPTF
jgi:hypothetical protein